MSGAARILVAGVGNVLEGDDGFGVRVVERLDAIGGMPEGVVVREVGIGGIHLVQDLMEGFDGLIVVDAVRNSGAPGTLYVLDPEVPQLAEADFRPDTHYAIPRRALMLARSLGVLPPRVYIVGCEPGPLEFGMRLSPAVRKSVAHCARIVAGLAAALAEGREPASPPTPFVTRVARGGAG